MCLHQRIPIPAAVALFALLLPTARGDAATVSRAELLLPVENCQPALPIYDGNIRKRPLGLQNEGNSAAFVTCAMKGAFAARPINLSIGVSLFNSTPAPVSATCTLVDGRDLALATPVHLTRTRLLAAGQVSRIDWLAADNGGVNYIYPAVSCLLSPGIAIASTRRTFLYED